MPKLRPVVFAGTHLGDIPVYGPGDWRNPDRAPTEADFRNVALVCARDFLNQALIRHPLQDHPAEPGVPWPLVVLREASRAALDGRSDPSFEGSVLRAYLDRYGMNQVIRIYGGDPGRVLERLDRIRSEEG